MLTLRLEIAVESSGAWLLALGDALQRPARARIEAEQVAALREVVENDLRSFPTVVRRGHDAARAAAEERAGRTLACVFASGALARALAQAQGSALARGMPLGIVIDVTDPQVQALPWEVLAAAGTEAPLEEAGRAYIARLAGAPPRRGADPPLGDAIRVLTWSPDPEEPACAAVLAQLATTAGALGLLGPIPLDTASGAFPAPAPGVADVLHVVCHGRSVAGGGVLVLGPEEARGLGTAAHVLSPGIERLALVVLDVCGGGSPSADQLHNLTGRLLATGAQACAAPRQAVHVDALAAFARGLYPALLAGGPLLAAVAAGRREVRGLADPHPDARWCNTALYVADLDVPSAQPVANGWSPASWPRASAPARALLERARLLAIGDGLGFLGVQHLARALALAEPAEPALCRLQALLPPGHDPRWQALSRGLKRTAPTPLEPRLSPRLRHYGTLLEPCFDLLDLFGLLVSDPHHGLHAMALRELVTGCAFTLDEASLSTLNRTVEHRWDQGEAPLERTPAKALQVIWGPEDGRVLLPAPGDAIGRGAPEQPAAHTLFADGGLLDRHLHRRQLTWIEPGWIALHHPARRLRGTADDLLQPGPAELWAGDLLRLTPATWLRALASLG